MRYSIFFIFLLAGFLFCQDKNKDFLMGSLVKSDEWEIDRVQNREYFRGNVFFENRYYIFKSSSAVYDHNTKSWNVSGNIYCMKKIEKNKYAEVLCDKVIYDENTQIAFVDSKIKKVEIKYVDPSSEIYKAYSKKATIDGKEKKITFNGEFEVISSSISAKSENAIYYESKDVFVMHEKPIINAITEDYALHVKGNEITLFRKENVAVIKSSVYGAIYRRGK